MKLKNFLKKAICSVPIVVVRSILLLCIYLSLGLVARAATQQRKITVSGIVTDSSGEPVIGASITEKGTSNGTISDVKGHFGISVSSTAILQISFIGYRTEEVTASPAKTSLKVILRENSEQLEEVVVVGYGVQKKANLTGSVASVNFKDVNTMPVANTTNMLQGRLPGVVLTNNGAQAGKDTPEIRIRGVGTLSGNNDPMVLIDGVEASVAQIAQIPAGDIDNVSVLKDAASASIYGVRAANGVILITTKRGMESKPAISYSGSIALQEATVLPDYVGSYDWAKMYNDAQGTDFYTPEMLQKIQDGSDPDHFANTDWTRELFHTAAMHQHHLSVSGGGKDTHYMISTSYFNQSGILKETGYERFNFRSNVDAKLGIVKIGLNLAGSKEKTDAPVKNITGDGLMRALTWYTRPTVPVKYSNGHWGCVDGTSISQTVFKNPVEELYQGKKDDYSYHFDGNVFAEVDIWKGLKFRSSLAYKFFMNDVSTFVPKDMRVYDADGNVLNTMGTNSVNDYHYLSTTYTNENILTYNVRIGKHEIAALLGHSVQAWREDLTNAYKENLSTDNLYELDAATANPNATGSAAEYALQSFFGRVNYNYDNRYLFEFNIRRDGSSRMPKANRYANFPSFSAAWVLTNESFMQNVEPLTSFKLRGSWGKLGNQEIGNYSYAPTMAAKYNYYFGNQKVIGMADNIVANDKIKWETTTITDVGFDASFWKGRISITFDWYNKLTSDILLKLAMPYTYIGFLDAPLQNAGKVQNRGWELSANYFDHKGDFSWNVGFNLSSVRNKIVDDSGGIDQKWETTINREGYPIGAYYGLKAIGIYRTEADLNRTNSKGEVIKQDGTMPALGDIMYEDTDDSGNVTSDDRVIIGNPFPKMSYSFNLGFSWKGIDVSTFWQGVAGIYRYNWSQATISNGGNMTTEWLDRWSEGNPNGSMPRLGNTENEVYSSFWLKKSDYLRLKNMEIGYTFPAHWLKGIGVQNVRFYVAGTNLLTFTPLKNYDPEKSSGDMRNDVHPNTRTYSFGVNVKF